MYVNSSLYVYLHIRCFCCEYLLNMYLYAQTWVWHARRRGLPKLTHIYLYACSYTCAYAYIMRIMTTNINRKSCYAWTKPWSSPTDAASYFSKMKRLWKRCTWRIKPVHARMYPEAFSKPSTCVCVCVCVCVCTNATLLEDSCMHACSWHLNAQNQSSRMPWPLVRILYIQVCY